MSDAEAIDTKRDIQTRARALEKQQRDERHAVLKVVSAKFRDAKDAIHAECDASGGHVWIAQMGEFAAPHWGTGLWPHRCRWCDMRTYR